MKGIVKEKNGKKKATDTRAHMIYMFKGDYDNFKIYRVMKLMTQQ